MNSIVSLMHCFGIQIYLYSKLLKLGVIELLSKTAKRDAKYFRAVCQQATTLAI